jgi:predicted amidohydrolase YtcJ
MYGDGALGSRGACMHKPYSDKPDQYGALLAISGLKMLPCKLQLRNFN